MRARQASYEWSAADGGCVLNGLVLTWLKEALAGPFLHPLLCPVGQLFCPQGTMMGSTRSRDPFSVTTASGLTPAPFRLAGPHSARLVTGQLEKAMVPALHYLLWLWLDWGAATEAQGELEQVIHATGGSPPSLGLRGR